MKIIVKTDIKDGTLYNIATTTITIGEKVYTLNGYLDMAYDFCMSQCMYQYRLRVYAEIFKALFALDKHDVTWWVGTYFHAGKGTESVTGTYPSHVGGHYQTYTYDFELDKEELEKWYDDNKDAIMKDHRAFEDKMYGDIDFDRYGKTVPDRWGHTDKKVIEYEWHEIHINKTDKGIFMRIHFRRIGGTNDSVTFIYEETDDVLCNTKEIELYSHNDEIKQLITGRMKQKVSGLEFESEDYFSYPDSQDYKVSYNAGEDYKEVYFRHIGEKPDGTSK